MDVLGDIVAETRRVLDREDLDRDAWKSRAIQRSHTAGGSHRFARALGTRDGRVRLIAEIKSGSPSAGLIVENPDVEWIASEYRDGGAAAISVVTEPKFFHGSREWLIRAATASGLPVVMKDFVVDDVQIYRGIVAGADAVLLIAAILEPEPLESFISILDGLGFDAMVEVHDENDLEKALRANANIIGVNNRSLRDFSVDLGTSEGLVRAIPAATLRVAESGIKTRSDIERLKRAGFDAFLVGESLLRNEDRNAAVRTLVEGSAE